MVWSQYSQQGIGNKLQEENLRLLKEKGVKAVVSKTTNKYSAKIMEKQGFVPFKLFSYQSNFDIPEMDDYFIIWYKVIE